MLLGEVMRLNAIKIPNKTALICGVVRLSYLELNNQINRLANALLGIGVKKGDRVAVVADSCSQFIEIYFATAKDGAIIVPVNTSLDSDGLAYTINDAGANTVIFGERYVDTINSIHPKLKAVKNYIVIGQAAKAESYEELVSRYPPDEPRVAIDEDDTAWLMYTSGTTGPPKGVMLSHKNLISQTVGMILGGYAINRNDVFLTILPIFYMGGLWVPKTHFYIGSAVILLEKPDPKSILETIERERVTTTYFTSPMAVPIINYPDVDKYDVSSVRIILYGGAPMPEGLQKRMNEIFGDICFAAYGMTEVSGSATLPPLMEEPREKIKRSGSCGKELPGVELKLVNETGEAVSPGEVGEVLIRGDNVMKGYWNMPEATAEALEGGYFHTGDLATKDTEGYYYITGRKKDTIISSGKLVYSPEIEDVMSLYPSISEVAVIGVPDVELGEAVKAVVVLKAGEKASEEEIIRWCASRFEDYKVPKSVDIVLSLPKTSAGKVLKRALIDKYN